MAARPIARKPLPSYGVIDLTQSDSEDAPSHRMFPSRPLRYFPAQSTPEVPISNHGLVLRGTFNFGVESEDIHETSYRAHFPVNQGAQSLVVNGPGSPHSFTPMLPQTHIDGSMAIRRSMGQSFSRTSDKATECRVQTIEPASKRRKTYGGFASGQSLGAAESLASMQDLEDLPQLAIIPVGGNLPTRGMKSQSKSRLSSAGRIQKPYNSLSRSGSNIPREQVEQEQRLTHVLCNQVFTHIKSAINCYRTSLSSAERSKIGQEIADKLVREGSFLQNFKANQWKLSPEYERKLSIRAKAYVDKYASEILRKTSHEGNLPGKKESPKGSEETPEKEENPTNFERFNRHGRNDIEAYRSSNSSSSDDGVFEDYPESIGDNITPSRETRQYSSSPTTSFSNDVNDGTSAMDFDSHDESGPYIRKNPPGRRQLRSSTCSNIFPLQVVQSREPVLSLKKYQSWEEQEPNMNALYDIQLLRLVGGHKGTPRPYISFHDRKSIRLGCEVSNKYPGRFLSRAEQELLNQYVLHVDFCLEELEFLCIVIQKLGRDEAPLGSDPNSQITSLLRGQESVIPQIIRVLQKVIKMPGKELGRYLLRNRETAAISGFLHDAASGKTTSVLPQVIQVQSKQFRSKTPPKPSITALLRKREISGMTPFRVCRGQPQFKLEISSHLEDALVRKSEWTDCCGDISTVSWIGEGAFVCGAVAHSDYHNMQYNKPGNLAFGSTTFDTLQSVADHRIIRPIVGNGENAENASESMRRTQDPWLYTSVVSTCHSEVSGYTFTASFDDTVKVWKVAKDGSVLNLCATWDHHGKVNFVVASERHHRVATASDVYCDAIRVYNVDDGDISDSPYDTYCGDKAQEQALAVQKRDTWAYFPATLQWGRSHSVEKLLLVGYSPRSVTAHESDIPEDKKNSGELCLWNVDDGSRVPISTARTQNVFEVMWHPTQPMFLAATSPCGSFEPETRTQIRLFAQNEFGSFVHIKALDCPAFDINELTIMPNSQIQCYVTASCTDGNTYVWDTAQSDRPIHTLGHGDSLDNPIHDLPREIADTGVKFASWGKTVNRFYTGSSDGKVKAWDIRKPKGHAFVRTVLLVSGGISTGAFSKNFSKLLIGDATGKLHLLEINERELKESHAEDSITTTTAPRGSTLPARRPRVIVPHPEPPPPMGFGLEPEVPELTAQDMAQAYLEEGQLTLHADRGIGAIQGPNYSETSLYRFEAHEDNDGTKPLRPEWQARQRYELQRQEKTLRLPRLPSVPSSDLVSHAKNIDLDFDLSRLSLSTRQALERDGVELDFKATFDYELSPGFGIFKEQKSKRKRTHNL